MPDRAETSLLDRSNNISIIRYFPPSPIIHLAGEVGEPVVPSHFPHFRGEAESVAGFAAYLPFSYTLLTHLAGSLFLFYRAPFFDVAIGADIGDFYAAMDEIASEWAGQAGVNWER